VTATLSRAGMIALRLLGVVFFLAGLAGIVLPLVPTVAFWILAALCWSRSAPGWRQRLTEHARYGAVIGAFLDHGVVPRTAKGYAVAAIHASGVLSSLALSDSAWALAVLWTVLALVSAWLVTRPEPTSARPTQPPGRSLDTARAEGRGAQGRSARVSGLISERAMAPSATPGTRRRM